MSQDPDQPLPTFSIPHPIAPNAYKPLKVEVRGQIVCVKDSAFTQLELGLTTDYGLKITQDARRTIVERLGINIFSDHCDDGKGITIRVGKVNEEKPFMLEGSSFEYPGIRIECTEDGRVEVIAIFPQKPSGSSKAVVLTNSLFPELHKQIQEEMSKKAA